MKESGRAVNTNGPCKHWFQTLYPTTVAEESLFFFFFVFSVRCKHKKKTSLEASLKANDKFYGI